AVAAAPVRHAAGARADVRFRRRDDDDRLPAALRRAVRHDAGWTGGADAVDRAAHVRRGLPLVEPRHGGVDRVRAVRDHSRGDGLPAAAAAEGAGMRTAASIVLHLALAMLALVAMAPLLWMVSASFMPTGEATAVPLRWLPSVPTLEHYRTLF